jgi:hypothetical protein
MESWVGQPLLMPKKLKLHIIAALGFLGMFCEASDFVGFWERFGEIPYEWAITWGLRLVFLALAYWFGRKAIIILTNDDSRR